MTSKKSIKNNKLSFKPPKKLVLKRGQMHDNFKVSDEIEKIEDYIIYKTNETLIKLKEIAPKINIDNIEISFSRKATRFLGKYNPVLRKFTYNIDWIEEHMGKPSFKKEIDEIISHEVAHVAYQDHSARWKILCSELGGNGERTYTNSEFIPFPQKKIKYIATCPTCGAVSYMTREPKPNMIYACATCHKNFIKDYGKFYGNKLLFEKSKLNYVPIEENEY